MEQNFVKRTIVIALVMQLFSSVLYSQSASINNQFWLQMPLYNAAASGVFNDVEIATGMQFGPNYSNVDTRNPEIYVRGDVFFRKNKQRFRP